MRVLHILNDLKFSGAEKMLYDSADWFEQNAIQTTVLSLSRDGSDGFDLKLKSRGYKICIIKFSRKISFFRQIYQTIKENNPDVVHIHTESIFFWLALISRLSVRNAKILRTIHSNFHFTNYLLFRRRLQRKAALRLLKVTYISISESVYDNEWKRFGIRTNLINNFIRTDIFDHHSFALKQKCDLKKTLEIPDGCLVLTTVGSCCNVKNHKVVFQLVKRLVDENIPVIYVHIGTGELEEVEKRLAFSLDILQYVRFIGNTLNVAEYLSITDIYLMPSLYEGVGISCIEALSMGCVVLANDTTGLNVLIKNGENGFLIPNNNLDEYAKHIAAFRQEPEFYRTIARSGIDYASQHYSIEKSMQSYIDAYNHK